MIKVASALLVLLSVWSAPGMAEEELSASKRADIEQLMAMTDAAAHNIAQQMSSTVIGQMTQMIRQMRPDVPQRVLDILKEEAEAAIGENIGDLDGLFVALYHKHFTAEEIKEMVRFYGTPLGKKTIQVMPVLMKESIQAGQLWGEKIGPVIDARISSRLKKEGIQL